VKIIFLILCYKMVLRWPSSRCPLQNAVVVPNILKLVNH
jgi:hypothetical protein